MKDGWRLVEAPNHGWWVVNEKGERQCPDCLGPTGDSGLRSGQCWPCKEKHGTLCWVCLEHCGSGMNVAYCPALRDK